LTTTTLLQMGADDAGDDAHAAGGSVLQAQPAAALAACLQALPHKWDQPRLAALPQEDGLKAEVAW